MDSCRSRWTSIMLYNSPTPRIHGAHPHETQRFNHHSEVNGTHSFNMLFYSRLSDLLPRVFIILNSHAVSCTGYSIVNFPLRSHNYCMYSTTVNRYLVNKAQANYELAGKCLDIVIKPSMCVNWCVDPCPTLIQTHTGQMIFAVLQGSCTNF